MVGVCIVRHLQPVRRRAHISRQPMICRMKPSTRVQGEPCPRATASSARRNRSSGSSRPVFEIGRKEGMIEEIFAHQHRVPGGREALQHMIDEVIRAAFSASWRVTAQPKNPPDRRISPKKLSATMSITARVTSVGPETRRPGHEQIAIRRLAVVPRRSSFAAGRVVGLHQKAGSRAFDAGDALCAFLADPFRPAAKSGGTKEAAVLLISTGRPVAAPCLRLSASTRPLAGAR